MNPSENQRRTASIVAVVIALAAPAEGLRRVAYDDTGGIPTVCEGHTGKDVVHGKVYSLDECKKLLDEDALKAVRIVEHCAPNLPPSVTAAFGDITFNEGPTAACDTQRSTAARYLLAGKYKEACLELPKWNKAKVGGLLVPLPGLTKRRNAEVDICLEGLS